MFPTLDPAPDKDTIGHWLVVSLDIPNKCFQYFDSLYKAECQAGWDIFERMVKNIKALWNAASAEDSMDEPLSPLTLDDFKTYYMRTPLQHNWLVGFCISLVLPHCLVDVLPVCLVLYICLSPLVS